MLTVYLIHNILYSPGHWVTSSTIGLTHPRVAVFDSSYQSAPAPAALSQQIASILCTTHSNIELEYHNIQQQVINSN